jgi:hypothetical protein
MSNFKDADIRQWRYSIKKLQLSVPGKKVDISVEKVKSFSIEEDFEKNIFPIFKITMILESSIYYAILKNKDGGKLYIRVDAYYQKVDAPKTKSSYYSYLSGNFNIVLDDNTADLLYSQKVASSSKDYTRLAKDNTNVLQDIDNEITFYLFRTDIIAGLKVTNINTVLHEATVTDAISTLAAKAGLKNIIIAPPDNKTIYTSLLIPPLSVLKAYEHIDSYYGIYKTGSIIYFGLDYTYIVPYNGECKAWIDNETKKTTTIIPKTDNVSHATILGELKNSGKGKESGKDKYIIGDYSTLDIKNQSLSNNYISGNDTQVVDSYTGDVKEGKSKTITKEDKNSVRMLENASENKFITSMYAAQASSEAMVINVNMQDEYALAFTPNKENQILFEDTKYADEYKGKYILSYVKHIFLNTGKDFCVNTNVTYKRAVEVSTKKSKSDAEANGIVPGL